MIGVFTAFAKILLSSPLSSLFPLYIRLTHAREESLSFDFNPYIERGKDSSGTGVLDPSLHSFDNSEVDRIPDG